MSKCNALLLPKERKSFQLDHKTKLIFILNTRHAPKAKLLKNTSHQRLAGYKQFNTRLHSS